MSAVNKMKFTIIQETNVSLKQKRRVEKQCKKKNTKKPSTDKTLKLMDFLPIGIVVNLLHKTYIKWKGKKTSH